MLKKGFQLFQKKENLNGKINNEKNILLIFFLIIGIIIIYNFRGHNQNKAIEACIAGSKKLDTPMTVEEAKEFCKQKIQNKQ